MPPPIALLLGLCALLIFASCDSSGGSDSDSDDVNKVDVTDQLTNPDFETGNTSGWTIVVNDEDWGTYDLTTNSYNEGNKTYYLEISNYNNSKDVSASITQTVVLYAGTYTASIDIAGGTGSSDLVFSAVSGEETLASTPVASSSDDTDDAWCTWITYEIEFTVAADDTSVTLGITGTLADSSYCDIDNLKLYLLE